MQVQASVDARSTDDSHELRLSVKSRDDRAPEGQVWLAEELIVGEVGNDEQLNGTAAKRGQFVSHPNGKESVFLTVDDENRDTAVSEGLLR